MKKKVRPLSPHLLIYEPQLTSIFSIFHRISGGLLVFFLTFLLIFFYCNQFFNIFFINYFLFSVLKFIFCFLVYFCIFILFFHMMNGLRHLSWDFSLGLEIKSVYLTGISILCFVLIIIVFIIII